MSVEPSDRAAAVERTLIRQIFDAAPPGSINLGLGQPDLATPPSIALAGTAAIASGRTGYSPTAGLSALREAIAERYPGLASGADSIVVTCGSQEAMSIAMLALTDPGQELLYPDPGYPAYPTLARLTGLTAVPYPLRHGRGFRLAAEDLLSRVGPTTGAVVLCAPSNPTGACHERRQLELALRGLERLGVPWISDEIYDGFHWTEDACAPHELSTAGVVLSGLSKSCSMTGWRLGWLVANPTLAARCCAIHQHLVTCAPTVAQHAALAAFAPRGRREIATLVQRFAARRELMGDALQRETGLEIRPPDGAFYFFVDVRQCGCSLELARRAREEQRVIVMPGEAFGERGRGFLRVSFAADEQSIVEGVRRLGVVLRRSG